MKSQIYQSGSKSLESKSESQMVSKMNLVTFLASQDDDDDDFYGLQKEKQDARKKRKITRSRPVLAYPSQHVNKQRNINE